MQRNTHTWRWRLKLATTPTYLPTMVRVSVSPVGRLKVMATNSQLEDIILMSGVILCTHPLTMLYHAMFYVKSLGGDVNGPRGFLSALHGVL